MSRWVWSFRIQRISLADFTPTLQSITFFTQDPTNGTRKRYK